MGLFSRKPAFDAEGTAQSLIDVSFELADSARFMMQDRDPRFRQLLPDPTDHRKRWEFAMSVIATNLVFYSTKIGAENTNALQSATMRKLDGNPSLGSRASESVQRHIAAMLALKHLPRENQTVESYATVAGVGYFMAIGCQKSEYDQRLAFELGTYMASPILTAK